MRRFLACLLFVTLGSSVSAEESYIPEKRIVVSRDVDFYGSDLRSVFDTSYDACIQICLNAPECVALTYNQNSNACFPKSAITDKQPYDGALSAEVFRSGEALQTLGVARATELAFLRQSDLSRAKDLASNIGRFHAGGPWSADEMIAASRARLDEGNTRSAMRWIGGALGKLDRSDLWAEYARLNVALSDEQGADRRTFQERGFLGAINAYLRADTGGAQINALLVLADQLEAQNRGKSVLRALRLADSVGTREDVAARLSDAIAKYGFSVSDHQVESDLAAPRLCVEFNEPLHQTGQDYEPFVKRPDARLAIAVEERRICVEGLTHGQTVEITLRAGLPAKSGETLIKDIPIRAYVRDRSPKVAFGGRAYVLPNSADAGLPIETVNLEEVSLKLQRVNDRNLLRAIQDSYFGQPLSYWQIDAFSEDVAETIWQGFGDVQNTLNENVTTRLPMAELVSGQPAGVYALTADVPGADKYDETSATQWFLLSDIGVTSLSGTDGLHVFVRHLSDAEAFADATVTLLSRANRVLGTIATDAQGYGLFDAGLTRGQGAEAPALLMVQSGEDFSFLSLKDPAFDLSDRGVEGRPAAPPIDLFVSTDRGAYRAGETVFVTALARDSLAQALPALPVTAILSRPDGVEYSRTVSVEGVAGGHVFALPLGPTVPRGRWSIDFKSDLDAPSLATAKILVEDFLPERLDFELTPPQAPFDVAQSAPLGVQARYLFGAPAADLEVEGQVSLRARTDIEGFEGYSFGRYDQPFYGRTEYFGGDVTNDAGHADVFVPLPEQASEGRPLMADVTVRVLEGSGRPVERAVSHPVKAITPLIGIKPVFEADVIAENSTAAFEVIALSPELTQTDLDVRWAINRIETRYQWYQLGGRWEWEPTTTRTTVAQGTASVGATGLSVAADVTWGRYEIVVEQVGGAYVSSAIDFEAGWYAPVDATETPDTLELSLNAARYRSGDTAQLRLVPRFAGKALVSVVSNRLIAMKAVDVLAGENLIDLPVTEEWGAGAYVTASVIRPADTPAGQNPTRALGLRYAQVDPGAKQLSVTLDAPEASDPRAALDVGITVEGLSEGETAFVTLAAVDVGILNLTRFESPDPSAHYFGQRRLGMEIRDIYGRLINGLDGSMGALRSGGDANAGTGFDSPPPTEELVAFFEGPIEVTAGAGGYASFEMPEFNGTVRLMAVAWSPRAVGQAEKDVLVRDPVVVTASLPRFLAPGDESRLLLEFTHASGPAGRMGLDVVANGFSLASQVVPSGLDLTELGSERLTVPITAEDVGDHSLRVALTTPDGKQLVKTLVLPVRSNDPAVSETQQIALAPGQSLTLGKDLYADLRSGTGETVLSSGALARFDAPGLLRALDRYPYGCTEQVTSQALPLLYFESVSEALGLVPSEDIDTRIAGAIERVLTRQASNGAFGLWRAGSGDFWLDAYVSDFLSRAKALGYDVPKLAFQQAMNNLRNRVNYAPDFDKGGEDLAYALLVLAREGAANIGDLRYYADVKAEAFATPLAAAQLGAALALYGDQTRADHMFRVAAAKMAAEQTQEETALWRVDYGTQLRDAAGILTLAVEARTDVLDVDALMQRVSAPDWALSTQESVWSLLAARALIEDTGRSGLSLDGQKLEGPLIERMTEAATPQQMTLRNEGSQTELVTVTTVGVPTYAVEASGYGYRITRQYFTLEGEEVQAEAVEAGTRLVAVLTVSPSDKTGARLMVNDPLPAGFEIDNPNLLGSGDVRALDWLDLTSAEHSEFRTDRFLAAVDWRSEQPFQLAYMVRAVSPGSYHHPAASVEDMYRPQYRANTAATRLVVSD